MRRQNNEELSSFWGLSPERHLGKNKSFLAVTNGEVNKAAARCENIPLPPLLHLKTVNVVLKGCSFITMAGCAGGPGVFVLTKKRLTHDKRPAQDTAVIFT